MFEPLTEYVGYLDTFKKLGVRPFAKEAILRKRLGDYVSILILRDILFSILLLSPKKYTSFLYSWGKFVGIQAAKQAKKTLKITAFTRLMTTIDPMNVLKIDIYKNALTKNWFALRSFIPVISYVDERARVFRVKIDECDLGWGLPNIGKKVCIFDGAIIAGSTEGLMNKSVNALETKCVASKSEYCEFLCRITPEFPKLEIIDKKYFKKIKNFILKNFFSKKKIRPTLGNYHHIASLQVTYLGLWLSSPGSHTILYWIGKSTGEDISKKFKGDIKKRLKKLIDLFKDLKIGVLNVKKRNGKFIFTVKDCAFSAGASNFEKKICSYNAGLLAGFLKASTKKNYNVIETKCVANGDKYCEFTTF